MSTALYNDATVSAYGNTPLPAENGVDLGMIDGNRLNLLPEHALSIYIRCLNHLAMCQLSSRCTRVFYAILNQTVGYKKLEDNITTTRLESLTKIRHDHAGQAMRDLISMNLLIHRIGGKHRNWLSVNFNLVTWGNPNTKASDKNNDPTILLPRRYVEEPIDQGIALHLGGEDFLDLPVFNPPEIETEAEPEAKPTAKTKIHSKPKHAIPTEERKAIIETQPSPKEAQTTEAVVSTNATQPSPKEAQTTEAAVPTQSAKHNSIENQDVHAMPHISEILPAAILAAKQNLTENQDVPAMPHIAEILPTVIPSAKQNPIIRQEIASQEIENPAIETAAITFTQQSSKETAGEETPNLVEISSAANKNAIETPRTREQIEQTLTQTVTALVEDKMQQLAQLIETKLQNLTQAAIFSAENTPPKQVAPHQSHAIPAQNAPAPDTQTPVKTVATPPEKQTSHPSTTPNVISNTVSNKPLDLGSLNYPEQLDAQQCEALHTLLHQCGDQARMC